MTEYVTVEQVIEIHEIMIKKYGGLPGIRDQNRLLSALDAPKVAMFDEEMYPTIYQKAAVYLYHLVHNHPFNDANKRTAYTTTLVFLSANRVTPIFKPEDLETLVVEVAKGKCKKETIAHFLECGLLKYEDQIMLDEINEGF